MILFALFCLFLVCPVRYHSHFFLTSLATVFLLSLLFPHDSDGRLFAVRCVDRRGFFFVSDSL